MYRPANCLEGDGHPTLVGLGETEEVAVAFPVAGAAAVIGLAPRYS